MRVYVTGAAGFVGSNVVHVAAARGFEVVAAVRSAPERRLPARLEVVDLLDGEAVRASVRETRPDAIVHAAILNDPEWLAADRPLAWASYVGTTRTLADAANAAGATLVYVSSDWVFDGTQAGATEATPPSPINPYGVLKLAGELVALERARAGAVCRIAGVMGLHRARPAVPRAQDAGFGYLVATLVDALERGEEFGVWQSDLINMVATPSLASASAGMMLDVVERGLQGIFHCCGGETATRMGLALAAAKTFELDPALLRAVAPDPAALRWPVPYDTSLDATATARALGYELPSLADLLCRFRAERREARLAPQRG